jgi:excisionase family DNA binding protein
MAGTAELSGRDLLTVPVLTKAEAAVRLGCTQRTVETYLWDGRLRAIRPGRRCTLVIAASVEELLRARDGG